MITSNTEHDRYISSMGAHCDQTLHAQYAKEAERSLSHPIDVRLRQAKNALIYLPDALYCKRQVNPEQSSSRFSVQAVWEFNGIPVLTEEKP